MFKLSKLYFFHEQTVHFLSEAKYTTTQNVEEMQSDLPSTVAPITSFIL